MTRESLLRYLNRFSEGQYALNPRVYEPGRGLFARVHTRWSLTHLGFVRRLELGPNRFFYFSIDRLAPYSNRPEVWSPISDAGADLYLNDPEYNQGLITLDSDEFPFNPQAGGAQANVNEDDASSSTSEFGA